MENINVFLAFGAGLLSFLSPCVLPLFPAFVSYITGMSVNELQSDNRKFNYKSIIHTVFFLLGFSVFFISLGFSSTYFGSFLLKYDEVIRQLSAILIVFFGLVIVGVLKFDFLMKDRSIRFKNKPAGYIGTFIVGLGFSLGWTPCMGPILASVLGLAASQPSAYLVMMISYVLGFAIPFLILSFFIGKMQWIRKHSVKMVQIGGYLMIIVGITLFFDWITDLTSFLSNWLNFSGF